MKWLSAFLALLIILLVGIYYIFDPENNELNEAARARLGGTYIQLSDGITHYKLEGPDNGSVVVLVHGGTVPIWTWDKQVQALNNTGFRTLSYDKYGRGYSDRPDVTYDQDLYKRQLLELVDKLALTEPFDLVGLSLGGGTAVNFTARYPDRVRKLVLISPLINNFKVPSFFRIPVFGEFMARIAGIRVIVNRFVSLFEKNPESEKYTRLFVEQTTYKGFQRSVLSMLRNDAVGDYSNAYQIIGNQKRDILLIWGTADTEITKEMIRDIRSFIPHLKFKPVEDVGHGIVFQEPDTVNNLIIGFL
ncbi:MAG: alpha/beta hydrolase [Deltaproteobacteria bacterium]|nr:alpha/beta hydrolase [Deltaproteobacteria bacterium]MBW2595841.1 alpha/beta hydrolase [Deltaproteobacteria bacterium]MBW2651017.1 alpha/beta hydrolase [Deltaproteobacteria bacterium]